MFQFCLAAATAVIWCALLFARGGFWHGRERDDAWIAPEPRIWPALAIVIPARDEAEHIGACLRSLAAQCYPGPVRIIVVDDESMDGTSDAAKAASDGLDLEVVHGTPRPPSWTGKLWALRQGLDRVLRDPPEYLLFTDADIVWGAGTLRALVARALDRHLVLASLMVRLRCASFAEKALIPAFVFFFQMLYPFAWVANPRARTAAAAGGAVLLDAAAFVHAGEVEAIRDALIDDCALGALMKKQGPVSLCLTERVQSTRTSESFSEVGAMITRSAYAQLHYSQVLLALTVAGLALTFLAAPALLLFGSGLARLLGAAVWLVMAFAMAPINRFYRLGAWRGLLLPLVASAYLYFTLQSARAHARGRGGMWKGRAQAMAARTQ